MDFLDNLAALALGKISTVKPLFTSISLKQNRDSHLNKSNLEISEEIISKKLYNNTKNDYPFAKEKRNSETQNDELQSEEKKNQFTDLQEENSLREVKPKTRQRNQKEEPSISLYDINNEVENPPRIKTPEENKIKEKVFFVDKNNDHKESGNKDSSLEINEMSSEKIIEDEKLVLGLKSKFQNENSENQFITKREIKSNKVFQTNFFSSENKSNINSNYSDSVKKVEDTRVVKINIGRIEVKAIYPEQKRLSQPELKKPQLSLDDYLRSFNKDKR